MKTLEVQWFVDILEFFFYILETLAIDMSYLQLYVNKATHMPNVVPIYSI